MGFIIRIYFTFRYLFARHSILAIYANFCETTEESLCPAFQYFWYQKYFLKVEYFRLKAAGENVKFEKIEQDYLNKRNKEINEAIDKIRKERDLFYKENGHWWQ